MQLLCPGWGSDVISIVLLLLLLTFHVLNRLRRYRPLLRPLHYLVHVDVASWTPTSVFLRQFGLRLFLISFVVPLVSVVVGARCGGRGMVEALLTALTGGLEATGWLGGPWNSSYSSSGGRFSAYLAVI